MFLIPKKIVSKLSLNGKICVLLFLFFTPLVFGNKFSFKEL